MSGPYNHLEVEAALCVWECINEWTLGGAIAPQPDWKELRDGVGSVELRHQSIALGKWCLAVYDDLTAHNPEFFAGVAYDWEVIPLILSHARDGDGAPVIYPHNFPPVQATAQIVAHAFCYDEFVSRCRSEATQQWSHADLIEADDLRVLNAFAAGEEPAAFVEWLGEKFDLIRLQ